MYNLREDGHFYETCLRDSLVPTCRVLLRKNHLGLSLGFLRKTIQWVVQDFIKEKFDIKEKEYFNNKAHLKD